MAENIPSFKAQSLCWLFLWLLIQVPILAGAFPTPPAEAVNNSLVQRAVGRVPFPKFADTYAGRVDMGIVLRELLRLSNKEAQEMNKGISIVSPFQDYRDLRRWGWTTRITWYPFKRNINGGRGGIPSYGNGLDEAFKDRVFPINKRQMGVYQFVQDKPFKPSNGSYTNVVNPKAGAFIFDDNWSPSAWVKDKGKGNIPELNALSDVAFLQWEDACQYKGVDVKNLKVVFRSNIVTKSSVTIIEQALKESGYKRAPGWKDRAVFSMDTRAGAAILGSTHGAAVAWMLLQHKDKLGLKTITEVAVWNSEVLGKVLPAVNLRFKIKVA
ncbi:hypothetical protein LZ30DRAFT_659455 [Colletotrichum cereale]|nr:hypothetical protein LZ30DRAFT_659455 [Colletotrichum cereale]